MFEIEASRISESIRLALMEHFEHLYSSVVRCITIIASIIDENESLVSYRGVDDNRPSILC